MADITPQRQPDVVRTDCERSEVVVLHVVTVPATTRFLAGQGKYMGSRGYKLAAVSSPGAELEAFANREGVTAYQVSMARRIAPFADIRAVRDLVRVIRHVQPDIVHAHTPKGGLLGTLAARIAGVPIRIYHIRGLPYATRQGFERVLLKSTERLSCALASRVLCVSRSVMAQAVDDGVVASHKIAVPAGGSGNGVDAEVKFDPTRHVGARARLRDNLGLAGDAIVIGFVGRIVRDKGIHDLVDAWRIVKEAFPRAALIIVGPEEERDAVDRDVIDSLKQDRRVRVIGEVLDIAPYFAMFDVLVLPTYREGFPNVLLEAGAMAMPVVATRVPGCVDAVIDGETGTLVSVASSSELAAALLAYLNDESLRRTHGAAARRHVRARFARQVIWDALHREYEALLKRSKKLTA